jgi:hypothetical protein
VRNAPDRIDINRPPVITDDDGIPEMDWSLGLETLSGLVTFLDVLEQPLWVDQQVTASARVPLSTVVNPGDRIAAKGRRWRVRTVRRNAMHLRVMLEEVK